MFNLDEVEKSKAPSGNLVSGFYKATISDFKYEKTKAGNGDMAVVTFDTESGKIWHRFNINNSSAMAQKIGREQIADLAYCCKVKGNLPAAAEDAQKLFCGKDLCINVIEKDDGENIKAEISEFFSHKGTHRDEKRNIAEMIFGPNGKPPQKQKGAKKTASKKVDTEKEDDPF